MFKKVLLVVVMVASVVVAIAAPAAYTVETVPNVRLADADDHVSDPATLLSQAAHDSINAMLSHLESSTGVEAAVVMLPSIGEADPFTFSVDLFRHWGIGKKDKNNGLLILYVEDQRKVRFTTGYGIEGEMTDALCKRIQMTYMVPSFKEGKRDEGMMKGCKVVASVLEGTMKADDVGADGSDEDNMSGYVAFFLLFVLLFVFFIFQGRKRKCPQCKKRSLELVSSKDSLVGGRHYRVSTYRCAHCGHIVVEKDDVDDDSGNILYMGMGSMFGNRGGGGGFGCGGSFGGGSTGGGGAGSSW